MRVTVFLGDLFYPPQFNRICNQESVNTDPSTVAPEEHESNSQITMALDPKIQQNIVDMIELTAPSDQDTKDVANHVAQKTSAMINALSGYKTKKKITKYIYQMAGRFAINSSANLSDKTTNNLAMDIMKFAPWLKAPLVEEEIELLPVREFAHFAYFVTECTNLLAPEDCQPERVIVPLQPTTSKYHNCDEESGLFGAKLEICDPDSDWRDSIDISGKCKLKRRNNILSFLGSAIVASKFEDVSKVFKEMGKFKEHLYGIQQNRGFI